MIKTLQTITPIDNSIYVEREYASSKCVDETLNKVQNSQKSWYSTPIQERIHYCSKAVDAFIKKKDQISEEISWQMGRPTHQAYGEIDGFEERARHMIKIAEESLSAFHCSNKEGFQRYITKEPLGNILVIAPWNYPFLTAVNAIIPALLAGNTVILKHSAQTPLAAERLYEAFAEAELPSAVFQYLHLTHEDSEKLIQDNRINAVVFTGSVSGGRRVQQAASKRFIPVHLELGGKDPAYVCADADIEQAVQATIDGAFFNSGQSCCGIERIYVDKDIYDEFLNQAINLGQSYQLGRPDQKETTIGPMVNASAADFIRQQIAEAQSQGAIAHLTNENFPLDKPGSAYKGPQILSQVNHSMAVMTEESFGPIVGIMPVDNHKQAIELMNDSKYGLTASVFTQNIEEGIRIGEQIDTGTFFINRCDYLDPELAWTGIKDSGRGCSLSQMGFAALTRPKSFHIKLR